MQLLWRFLIGGVVVTMFAALGDVLRPKSFAGLFSAAPSIALGTLSLTLLDHTSVYVATEARSMAIGAGAFVVYACIACHLLLCRSLPAAVISIAGLALWLIVAFTAWFALRAMA